MSARSSQLFWTKQRSLAGALYLRVILAICGVAVALYGAYDLYTKMHAFALTQAVVKLPQTEVRSFRASAPALTPVRLIIPTIGVNVAVEAVGKNANGAMATPKKFTDAAWYELGAKPGDSGNAVFAGHVNNALTKAGVFEHLSDLQTGDTLSVVEESGYALTFAVTDLEDYTDADAPLASIFAKEGPSGLVLITCAGDWDPRAHAYNKRLVIYTRLLSQ